jgi:DNA-binding winged helix-turn-helix (wHTH) protein
MDVLFALAETPDQVVSLQQLMDAAWSDVDVAPESVYQTIAILRRAFANDSDEPDYIITVPKRGYRLATPVKVVSLADEQRPLEESDHRHGSRANVVAPRLVLGSTALLLMAIVFLARFLTSDPETGSIRKSIVVVASDNVAGSLADKLVPRFLDSEIVQLLNSSAPMYSGPNMDLQVSMARALDADFVISLSQEIENQISLTVLALRSGSAPERQRISIDYADPDNAARYATERVEEILGASEARRDDGRESEGSISDAAQLNALGRHFLQRRFTRDGKPTVALDQARDAFLQAIDATGDFVPAWTGLALTHVLRSQYGPQEDAIVHITAGRAAIDKALALAPDSAEAHAALGLAAEFEGDSLASMAALERAVDLEPGNPMVLRWLAATTGRLGYYPRAASLAVGAAEVSPFSKEVLDSASLYGYLAGNLDTAITYAEAALKLEPGDESTTSNLFVAYREIGRLDMATATGQLLLNELKSSRDEPHGLDWVLGMISDVYVDLGLLDSARVLAVQAEKHFPAAHETAKTLVRLALAEGDVGSARRRITDWSELPNADFAAAEVAVHAIIVGLENPGLRLLEALPPGQELPDGMNPMIDAGRWLKRDYLYFASLPAVYRALLHLRAGERREAQTILSESGRFLDYWIEQGFSRHWCLYLRAAVHGMQNEVDAGLEALSAAVESGWRDAWRIRNDPALD